MSVWKLTSKKSQICKKFAKGLILDVGCSKRQAERYCNGKYGGFNINFSLVWGVYETKIYFLKCPIFLMQNDRNSYIGVNMKRWLK